MSSISWLYSTLQAALGPPRSLGPRMDGWVLIAHFSKLKILSDWPGRAGSDQGARNVSLESIGLYSGVSFSELWALWKTVDTTELSLGTAWKNVLWTWEKSDRFTLTPPRQFLSCQQFQWRFGLPLAALCLRPLWGMKSARVLRPGREQQPRAGTSLQGADLILYVGGRSWANPNPGVRSLLWVSHADEGSQAWASLCCFFRL